LRLRRKQTVYWHVNPTKRRNKSGMNQHENSVTNDSPSGNLLVLGIFGVAVAAAVLSWIYRYQATHDSQQFWGPNFSRLIAEPAEVTAFRLDNEQSKEAFDELQVVGRTYYRRLPKDVTKERGMIHLRNSILTDANYNWDKSVQTDDWKWCLQFAKDELVATILFNQDFTILGRLNRRGNNLRQVDCSPMADKLRAYFASADIFPTAKTDGASKAAE
jgi:hypothetical protein